MKTKKVDVVAGYSYPNDKNALWFDLNTNTMRYWDGEKWESSLSEGSSLPTPTAEDDSKIMLVTPVQKGTRTEETVIVPEQTCNMEDFGKFTICTLQNVDESFGEGFSGIAILDGIEYNVEWSEDINGFGITEDISIEHLTSYISFELADRAYGLTHTIKVITRETEPIYDYNWAPGVKIPVPTAEDVGKVLKVVDKPIETTERVTIVPRLTVLLVDNSTEGEELITYTSYIQNVNDTAYDICNEYNGTDTVKVIIDGVYCNYTTEHPRTLFRLSTESGFDITFYDKMLGIPDIISRSLSGPHTIEIYADIPTTHHEYVWEMVDEDVSPAFPGVVIDPGDGDK